MNPAGKTDDWFTPMALFRELDARHEFTLDPCGHTDSPVSQAILGKPNGRATVILAPQEDGLAIPWRGESVFCNPPYSNISPWAAKAHMEIRARCPVICMLVPANRTEQPWWQEFVEPYRDGRRPDAPNVRTHFLPKRPRFGFPGDPAGKTGHQPTFGCVLITWEAK